MPSSIRSRAIGKVMPTMPPLDAEDAANLLGDGLTAFGIEVENRDPAPFSRQGSGCPRPEAGRPTRDHRRAIRQLHAIPTLEKIDQNRSRWRCAPTRA